MTGLKECGYDDIKVIGRGQYGLVHLVRRCEDQHLYVCKKIDLTCWSEKEREKAQQEVELLRRLDHPNIVAYKESFFMADAITIVMQHCEGGDLATYVKEAAKRRMRIREPQIMNYFVQVLQALNYIHNERVLHRDLKTSNLFLMNKASVVKVGDFGISRVLDTMTDAAFSVVGTPHYMSPEVCENKPYTFKSDVWSLGCVLYELCMLKHPFVADNLLGLVHKIVSEKFEPISPMYSALLSHMIQRMLTKAASARPSIRMILDDRLVQNCIKRPKPGGHPAPSTSPGTTTNQFRRQLAPEETPKEAMVRRRPEARRTMTPPTFACAGVPPGPPAQSYRAGTVIRGISEAEDCVDGRRPAPLSLLTPADRATRLIGSGVARTWTEAWPTLPLPHHAVSPHTSLECDEYDEAPHFVADDYDEEYEDDFCSEDSDSSAGGYDDGVANVLVLSTVHEDCIDCTASGSAARGGDAGARRASFGRRSNSKPRRGALRTAGSAGGGGGGGGGAGAGTTAASRRRGGGGGVAVSPPPRKRGSGAGPPTGASSRAAARAGGPPR